MIKHLLKKKFFVRRRHFKALHRRFESCGNETLVIKGRDVGFFSMFFQIIGAMDFCSKRKLNLLVDFDKGAYFDESVGPNWWEYYFSENEFIYGEGGLERLVIDDTWTQKIFSYYGRALPPKKAFRFVEQITIREEVLKKISAFLNEHEEGQEMVGLHYRGTDKVQGSGKEAAHVPYEYVADKMCRFGNSCKFFIATDEQRLLDYMREIFPEQVIYYDAIRSNGSESIHNGFAGQSMYKAGEDALIDCLLLSKCKFLLRTDSNLSYACSFFNPEQKSLDITKEYLRTIS